MQIQVKTASGGVLDWMVAKCEKQKPSSTTGEPFLYEHRVYLQDFIPSTNWAHGGSIIDREDIEFVLAKEGGHHESAKWMAVIRNSYFGFGEEHLIAAMRCYVVSNLGDIVDVPDELC